MMTMAEKVIVGLAVAAGAVGVGVAIAKSSSAASTPAAAGTTPATSGKVWVSVTQLSPGDHVRASLSQADFQTLASSLGVSGTDVNAWSSVLAFPTVQSALVASAMTAWAPGQALPADWPADDPTKAAGYHVEFTYGGTAPVMVSALPLPVKVWVARGLGA